MRRHVVQRPADVVPGVHQEWRQGFDGVDCRGGAEAGVPEAVRAAAAGDKWGAESAEYGS